MKLSRVNLLYDFVKELNFLKEFHPCGVHVRFEDSALIGYCVLPLSEIWSPTQEEGGVARAYSHEYSTGAKKVVWDFVNDLLNFLKGFRPCSVRVSAREKVTKETASEAESKDAESASQ